MVSKRQKHYQMLFQHKKNFKILFFVFYFLFAIFPFSLSAQCFKLDSLRIALSGIQQKVDTTWVNTSNLLANEYFINKQYAQADFYASQAYKAALQIKYRIGQADALIYLGNVYFKDDEKKKTLPIENYKKALEIYQETKNDEKISNAHKIMADYYYNQSYLENEFYKLALENYLKALSYIEKSGNKLKAGEISVNIGVLYDKLGDEAKSTDFFLKAVNFRSEVEDKDVDNPHLFSKAQRFYDLQIKQRENYLYIFVGGAIFLVLIIILMAVIVRQRQKSHTALQKQKNEIEIQKQLLEQSHEEVEAQRDELLQKNEFIEKARIEIKNANEALTDINSHLNELVRHRTEQVISTNTELTKVNTELDLLIYRASHDFKGPVATLVGLAQLAKITSPPDNPALEYVEKIEETSHKMDRMLDKLHQISYLRGKEIEMTLINFQHLIEDVEDKFEDIIKENKIVFEKDIETYSFQSDYEILEIVIQNLIENAINFRTQEPDRTPSIYIQVKEHIDWLYIKIRDNGTGISFDHLPKIYDMFFRGSELSKGNGLGLYVVKNALERLDIDVEVSSIENTYTDFHIRIPK
ncbi:MAG: sensor histidine kinase [Bacteroidetes bacterium]|nr:MAG: sensor histidine kinase [Bacteroidota bacterium]TAG93187.1 MAG: sensor histidine kinase [Bacteroidota bacterium]